MASKDNTKIISYPDDVIKISQITNLKHMLINNIQLLSNKDFSPLRNFWSKLFNFRWQLGIALILLFGIPRFLIVMHSYVTGSYVPVMYVFIIMWFFPLILLNKDGRRSIGFKKPRSIKQLILSFFAGAFSSIVIFYIFTWLYEKHYQQCFCIYRWE